MAPSMARRKTLIAASLMTTVLTRIPRRQGEPVDYRMHRRGTRWLIYDVGVEGVSLVANYRVQFNSIIQTSS